MPRYFRAVSDSSNTISLFAKTKRIKLIHSGVLTDYQYYETFDYEPAMLNNFDDIRFTTQSGEHIPYWIETKTDGVSAKVWFMNDYVDGDTYIWMYYGNDGLTSESSGSDTFIQWHGAATSAFHDSNIISSACVYESKTKATAAEHNILWGLSNTVLGYDDDALFFQSYDGTNWRAVSALNEGIQTRESEAPVFTNGVWYKTKCIFTGSVLTGYIDDNQIGTNVSSNIPDENMGLFINPISGTMEQEWSFIRKYTATEPTITVGAEQHPKTGDMMIL